MQKKVEKANEAYKKNPSSDNYGRKLRTEFDLKNATRDNECLIKGCVPKEYIKPTTHKKAGIK